MSNILSADILLIWKVITLYFGIQMRCKLQNKIVGTKMQFHSVITLNPLDSVLCYSDNKHYLALSGIP